MMYSAKTSYNKWYLLLAQEMRRVSKRKGNTGFLKRYLLIGYSCHSGLCRCEYYLEDGYQLQLCVFMFFFQ